MNRSQLLKGSQSLGISLSEDIVAAFADFENDLYDANEVMNLTRVPREECLVRHFFDSLLMCEFVADGQSLLDVGCGPGFPAWPIAATRPLVKVVGLDSSTKMLGFLERHLRPNLVTRNGRAEEVPTTEQYDVVTGRALAPLGVQLEISAAMCKVGGAVIPMRTPGEDFHLNELAKIGLSLERIEERMIPTTDVLRTFPIFRKVSEAVAGFPRKWSEIRRKPLR